MDILNVNNLTFNYKDDLPILKNLSFQVKNNELVSIVGSSGCGKSTVIKILAGIEKPIGGDIFIKSI
ncbi:MAG: ATP-binding cassette domain-containing protein, partial [Cetobacterium sp.]